MHIKKMANTTPKCGCMQMQLLLSAPDISTQHHSLRCLTFFLLQMARSFSACTITTHIHNHNIWQSCLSQMLWNLKEQVLQGSIAVARLLQPHGELFSPFPGQHQQRLITHNKSRLFRLHSAEVGFWEKSWANKVEWAGLCSNNSTWFKLLKPYKFRELFL